MASSAVEVEAVTPVRGESRIERVQCRAIRPLARPMTRWSGRSK
jgi:hypothetical protein